MKYEKLKPLILKSESVWITEDIIYCDLGMFGIFYVELSEFQIESAWFETDPREVKTHIREYKEWKNNKEFLKGLVIDNLEVLQEVEP